MNRTEKTPNNAERDGDARLSALMKEWSATEPSPAFDRGVWARIQREAAKTPPRRTILNFLRLTLAQPAWAAAAAAAVGIVMGMTAALAASRPAVAGTRTERLLPRDTLAGADLALTTGGSR